MDKNYGQSKWTIDFLICPLILSIKRPLRELFMPFFCVFRV